MGEREKRMSLNTCTLSGNLGSTAELRYTSNKVPVLRFPIAVNERRRQQDGTYADYTNWLNCTMFGNRAEALQPYLARGSKVSIIGHLRQHSYEKGGVKCNSVEIIVDEVELMNIRRKQQNANSGDSYEADIPF